MFKVKTKFIWLTSILVMCCMALTACGGDDSDSSTSSASSLSGGMSTAAATSTTAVVESGIVYYVATTGDDTADGSFATPWATIAHAQEMAVPGAKIYIRGGVYAFTAASTACKSQTDRVSAITLDKSGTSGSPISYLAYPGENPHFDFSGMTDDCRIKGFNVTGSWIYLKGLEISGVPQNNDKNHESWGVWISGSHNTFELLDIHHNMGPGLFINNGSYNLVLNTDSHHNYDRLSSNGAGQSADGFGVHIAANNPGNVLRGCRAWWNSDDGFDLINAYSSVTIQNSWAWLHGYIPGTTTPLTAGNGNGFKMGGYGGDYDANAVKHTVSFSVAFLNKAYGFYANHHPVANDYLNNTSFNNRAGFFMLGVDSSGAVAYLGRMRNNVSYGETIKANDGADQSSNSWNLSQSLSDADFVSVATTGWDVARQSDGSLPVLTMLRPATGGLLIDGGVNIGGRYSGSAPDLGAFEYGVDMTVLDATN
jgi:hypothetical protein